MKLKIDETGEIRELSIIDSKTGCDWVADLVGNAGCFVNGMLKTDPVDDQVWVISSSDYDWWADYISQYEADEDAIADFLSAIAKKYDDEKYEQIKDELYTAIQGSDDYDEHHRIKKSALADFRAEYLGE